MKISVITCTTPGRSQAFGLCETYMARQTLQPHEWIVMGDEKTPMPAKVLQALSSVTGDAIAFVEDDDWYGPEWLSWLDVQLERGYDIVGEGQAIYYHVSRRWWSDCCNVRHASLCQTAINTSMVPQLVNTIQAFDNPFFDCRLWRLECNKMLRLPHDTKRHVIGIKGMPGTPGYSPEHRQRNPARSHADPSLIKLWQLIGDDAEAYRSYFKRK